MQCFSCMFIFNMNSKYRIEYFANKWLICYMVLILVATIYFLLIANLGYTYLFGYSLMNYDSKAISNLLPDQINKILALISIILNFIAILTYEVIVNKIFDKNDKNEEKDN